ncbi:MAG: hypothetical protein R3F07_10720 [Opitutaceae bacterium]
MNGLALTFTLLSALALLLVPRRWAFLPLLAGVCYITYGQGIEVGALNFTVVRILIFTGFVRAISRGERIVGGFIVLDWVMIAWGLAAAVSSLGHDDPSGALIYRLGLFYDCGGVYLLVRTWCRDVEDAVHLLRVCAFLLVPVAFEMLTEKLTGQNSFSVFGGVSLESAVREGRIRAQGPFMHPILAGTVGAVCLPLLLGFWQKHRWSAVLGSASCLTMVFACGSSGPMMSAIFAIGALFLWRYRTHMRTLRWMAVLTYIGLDLVMKVPAYYLLGRFDLAGGSTGWHRAELINSGIRHLDEWWLAGTDYTRHWMPTGVSWNPNHTDITNHYLAMGVLGGLPLMILFIVVMVIGFSYVGQSIRAIPETEQESQRFVWALGASLFANAATCISVSYFDQSFVFLYLTLGSIASVKSMVTRKKSALETEAPASPTASQVTKLPIAYRPGFNTNWSTSHLHSHHEDNPR